MDYVAVITVSLPIDWVEIADMIPGDLDIVRGTAGDRDRAKIRDLVVLDGQPVHITDADA